MPIEALRIEMRPIDFFRPYSRTLRRNDHAVKRMVAAIEEFGFRIPLLVRSDGELIDGHLRLKAAARLRLPELPVILCDDWTPAQVKAFRLSVNRSASWADWDWTQVSFELNELKIADFDLDLTGFSGFEIDSMLRDPESASGDSVPDLQSEPVTRTGDVGRCGTHRVLCGDSTSAADVGGLLGSETSELMITSLPY